jgi:spoIIIJ-associated protein
MSDQTDEMQTDELQEAPETTDESTDESTDEPTDEPTESTEDAAAVEDADADSESDDQVDEGDESDSEDESEEGGSSRQERLENEGDIAADYLEELLDIADLDGDLDMDVEGDRASVSIVGADLQQLVGRHGEVLDALQELTRLAVYRETGERSRLMLDVSGFRAEKREELVALAEKLVAQVKESGEAASLDPMSPFERKVVHDAVAAAGLSSESEGVEPRRFVVILPG